MNKSAATLVQSMHVKLFDVRSNIEEILFSAAFAYSRVFLIISSLIFQRNCKNRMTTNKARESHVITERIGSNFFTLLIHYEKPSDFHEAKFRAGSIRNIIEAFLQAGHRYFFELSLGKQWRSG